MPYTSQFLPVCENEDIVALNRKMLMQIFGSFESEGPVGDYKRGVKDFVVEFGDIFRFTRVQIEASENTCHRTWFIAVMENWSVDHGLNTVCRRKNCESPVGYPIIRSHISVF